MNNDLFGGRYTSEEVQRILQINARPTTLMKPEEAYYKKSAMELEPTNKEKREFVHFLIYESNISQASKQYLQDTEKWIPKYQLRGLKYGIVTSALTFACFPVIRRQPFVRRFAISMLPMAYFLKWGYTWGHENWWRRAKEVVVTYEIFAGTRSKFTMK
jgi:hypothetical protein